MSFDWRLFLSRQNVEYVTHSANIGRHQIGVKCPFCGDADHSQHLAISLRGEGWVCRRNRSHSGKSRARLIQALLRIPMSEARVMAGETPPPITPSDDSFKDRLSELMGGETAKRASAPTRLSLPEEFKPLQRRSSMAAPFLDYMERRGYSGHTLDWLSEKYQLHYATRGEYRYRVIFPIYDEQKQLRTWTGRTILPDEPVRYKTLLTSSDDPDRTVALSAPGDLLLGLPLLWGCGNPRALVVSEGPMDGLRMTALGYQHGLYGTCLFGLNASEEQARLLDELTMRFPNLWLLLDGDAAMAVFRVLQRFATLPCKVAKLPSGVKDPDELNQRKGEALVRQLLAA